MGNTISDPASSGLATEPGTSDPLVDEVCTVLTMMGVQPGRNCVVGDGLAVVDLGIYVAGMQVALEVDRSASSMPLPGSSTSPSSPSHPALGPSPPKASFATLRAKQRVLEAHGWHTATLSAALWQQLTLPGSRQQYLADVVNTALGGGGGGASGGGCCGGGCGSGKASGGGCG